ncbi:MAG: chloride channel protein [Spirosomataceae bacterium]
MNIKTKRIIIQLKSTKIAAYLFRYLTHSYDKAIEANSVIKHQFLQFLPFLIASLITGIVAFSYSKIFHYAERLSKYIFEKNSLFIFISTPVSFIISWWLVKRFASYAKGSGIPQVMASVELAKPNSNHLIVNLLSVKIIIIKIISSAIKVIGGGILGREGPTIQISSSIFNQTYLWLPKWWKPISQKNILIAGAASGLAAAFNTPLGGIIFAIEELSKFHIKHYKSPLFIAVIIAGLTAQGLGGPYLYLGYPKTVFSGIVVYVGILTVSIVTGIFGSIMCRYLLKFLRFVNNRKTRVEQLGVVVLSGFIVATSIYLVGPDAMGSGKELMERTLFTPHKGVEWYLPFVRMNGLIASFGMGGAGGIFAPSLSSGAGFGALIAQLLGLTNGNANLLILIGMTGFLTAVTRAPFTSAIIIFEMTDRHSIIFFLLLGALIANIIAAIIEKHSFYDLLKENYLKELQESSAREAQSY